MVCADTELPSITAAINFTTYYFTGMSIYLLITIALSSHCGSLLSLSIFNYMLIYLPSSLLSLCLISSHLISSHLVNYDSHFCLFLYLLLTLLLLPYISFYFLLLFLYHPTAEYGLRLLTVWAVSSRVAGVIPSSWESLHKSNPDISIPIYSPWYQTFKFIFRFKNLVDLASILPSYTSYFLSQSTNTNFVRTLRLLRLVRVLRLMKLMSFLKNVSDVCF